MDRSQELSIDDAQLSAVGATSLPFLISGALSFRDGRFDPRQSAILVDIALGNVRLESVQDLLAIGRALGVRSPEMRSEMVYADAPIASLASVIFAHHEAVPALMNELAVGINHAGVEVHPYLQAIVTGFYCVHVHPFLDGRSSCAHVRMNLRGQDGAVLVRMASGNTLNVHCAFENYLLKRSLSASLAIRRESFH
ncbi:MAG: Fic family protein [Xanthomonadales bacterium]|nr:Fic family protein [Xanthomonadales bacterium]